jgi:O-antigen/teichoic acid export membrane protein
MTVMSTSAGPVPALTTRNRAGLALAGLLGLADLVFLAFPTPEGEEGPPIGILVLTAVLGVVTLVAVAVAWRSGNRAALRLTAVTRILSAVTALPAFFVDVPAALKAGAAVLVVLAIVSVVLMLTPGARRPAVTD